MKVRDIMTADPVAVLMGESVQHAASVMRELNIGAVPVVQDVKSKVLLGIITDRDIVIRCSAEGHAPDCAVQSHMTPLPLETASPDEDIHLVIDKMERNQVRRIPVVTADNVLLGVIAQADIATKFGPMEPFEVEELLERVSAPSVPAHA